MHINQLSSFGISILFKISPRYLHIFRLFAIYISMFQLCLHYSFGRNLSLPNINFERLECDCRGFLFLHEHVPRVSEFKCARSHLVVQLFIRGVIGEKITFNSGSNGEYVLPHGYHMKTLFPSHKSIKINMLYFVGHSRCIYISISAFRSR